MKKKKARIFAPCDADDYPFGLGFSRSTYDEPVIHPSYSYVYVDSFEHNPVGFVAVGFFDEDIIEEHLHYGGFAADGSKNVLYGGSSFFAQDFRDTEKRSGFLLKRYENSKKTKRKRMRIWCDYVTFEREVYNGPRWLACLASVSDDMGMNHMGWCMRPAFTDKPRKILVDYDDEEEDYSEEIRELLDLD